MGNRLAFLGGPDRTDGRNLDGLNGVTGAGGEDVAAASGGADIAAGAGEADIAAGAGAGADVAAGAGVDNGNQEVLPKDLPTNPDGSLTKVDEHV